MAALRGPVVRRSLRFGREERTAAGKGVRSRIVDMIVNGCRRAVSAAWSVGGRVVGKVVSEMRLEGRMEVKWEGAMEA